jgi:hypothetical protein
VASDLLDQGVRMGWTVSKAFGRKLVDEVSDGFSIMGVAQMGDGGGGGAPGIDTDHS